MITRLSLLFAAILATGIAKAAPPAPLAPEFPDVAAEHWLNSPPLTLAGLRDQVILIEFWTYGCVNCRRTIPWVKDVLRQLHDQPFNVVGIHTPEFADETVRANVARKVSDFEIRHPVMMDNDFKYWNAMGNRFWPAFYLIDGNGRVRGAWAGEVHVGTPRANALEARIRGLIQELPAGDR